MDIVGPIAILAAIVGLFVLHRTWNGKLDLFNKNSSGPASVISLQEIVEPNVKHVMQIKEQNRHGEEYGPPPPDDSPSEKQPIS